MLRGAGGKRSDHPFSLSGGRSGSTFGGMNQPDLSLRRGVRPMRTALRVRHGFTLPSNGAADSAAQFNSSVSITPPHPRSEIFNAFWRRHDGYTAKC